MVLLKLRYHCQLSCAPGKLSDLKVRSRRIRGLPGETSPKPPIPHIISKRQSGPPSMDRDDHGRLRPPDYGEVESQPTPSPPGTTSHQQPLKYRKKPLVLFVAYAALMLVPWILTCILYFSPAIRSNSAIGVHKYNLYRNFMATVSQLNNIGALVSLPIVYSLLSHGAVAYCQRRSSSRQISVTQLFSLASMPWDMAIRSSFANSLYLRFSAAMLLLSRLPK
jgi:hypothetical protein